jgi:hypothetical protein
MPELDRKHAGYQEDSWRQPEVLLCSLLLMGFGAWMRRQKRTGLAKLVKGDKQAVHMPVDFLKPEPRKLSELAPGATACVDFPAIAVDLSGKTYIDLDSRVYEEPHSNMVTVKEMDGGYILSIPKRPRDPMLFTPRRLLTSIANYARVIQIAEDDNDRFRDCLGADCAVVHILSP